VLSFAVGEGVFNYRVVGVLIHADRVLLQRADSDDFWALPGGRGEFGEASGDTIRRELREEIGLDVAPERLLWVVENFFDLKRPYHEISLYYALRWLGALPAEETFPGRSEDRDPPITFRWTALTDLDRIRLYPSFLGQALLHLPTQVTHIVHRDHN